MKNIVKSFAMLALVIAIVPSVSFAAPMNFLGFGFVQPSVCNVSVDHGVYNAASANGELIGCWTQEAMSHSESRAQSLQNTGYKFGPLQSVTLKDGRSEMCPLWYFAGCVIDRDIIR